MKMSEDRTKNIILLFMLGIFIILLAIAIALAFFKSNYSDEDRERDVEKYIKRYDIPYRQSSSAKHTMVEFTDLRCPDCRTFHERYYRSHLQEKVENGKLNYVSIYYPVVDKKSYDYANMTRAISQSGHNDVFYRFVDIGYETSRIDNDPTKTLKRLSLSAKDEKDILSKYNKIKGQKVNKKELEDTFNINQTPTIFIDGEPITDVNKIEEKLEE